MAQPVPVRSTFTATSAATSGAAVGVHERRFGLVHGAVLSHGDCQDRRAGGGHPLSLRSATNSPIGSAGQISMPGAVGHPRRSVAKPRDQNKGPWTGSSLQLAVDRAGGGFRRHPGSGWGGRDPGRGHTLEYEQGSRAVTFLTASSCACTTTRSRYRDDRQPANPIESSGHLPRRREPRGAYAARVASVTGRRLC